MRTWTEADRQRHSELMREKLLSREWQPWQTAGDRSHARYNALKHGNYSQAALERRRLRVELRSTLRQLATSIEQNLQFWQAQEFDRVSSPSATVARVERISKRLRRVNSEVTDLLEYRKNRKKK